MPCKNQVYDKEEQACNRVKLQNTLPTRRTAAALLMQEYAGCALILRAEGFSCCRGPQSLPCPVQAHTSLPWDMYPQSSCRITAGFVSCWAPISRTVSTPCPTVQEPIIPQTCVLQTSAHSIAVLAVCRK